MSTVVDSGRIRTATIDVDRAGVSTESKPTGGLIHSAMDRGVGRPAGFFPQPGSDRATPIANDSSPAIYFGTEAAGGFAGAELWKSGSDLTTL
jgi:hypothetical protein